MKINKQQKRVWGISLSIILLLIAYWLISGGEIFTKDKILVEEHDTLFDTTYTRWEDKFVLGLDYTAAASFIVLVISFVFSYIFRTKKNK